MNDQIGAHDGDAPFRLPDSDAGVAPADAEVAGGCKFPSAVL